MYELSRPLPVNQGSLGLDDIIFITLNTDDRVPNEI